MLGFVQKRNITQFITVDFVHSVYAFQCMSIELLTSLNEQISTELNQFCFDPDYCR